MYVEECPFKVVRTNGGDEVLARAANLLIGKAAFETARRMRLPYTAFGRRQSMGVASTHPAAPTWRQSKRTSKPTCPAQLGSGSGVVTRRRPHGDPATRP
jgi:hypothetical protein